MSKNIVQAKEEQKFIWLSRILVIFVTIGAISNVILFWTFLKIMPNTKVQPIYIRAKDIKDKDVYITKNMFNMVSDLPIEEQSLYGMKYEQPGYYMAMNMIKKYIIDRESFIPDADYLDMVWGENSDLKFMSDDKNYKNFIGSAFVRATLDNTKISERGVNKKTVRFVDAPSVSDRLSNNPEWIANIIIDEVDSNGKVISSEQKRIRVQGHFDPKRFVRNEKVKYKNPLGFIITKYQVE